MADVPQRPPRRKDPDLSIARERLEALETLDLADAAKVRTWLTHLEEQIDDAVAAGEDATRPIGLRELGRCMARKKMLDARESLGSLIEMAKRGMETKLAGLG